MNHISSLCIIFQAGLVHVVGNTVSTVNLFPHHKTTLTIMDIEWKDATCLICQSKTSSFSLSRLVLLPLTAGLGPKQRKTH